MCEKPVVFVIGSSGTVGVATLTSLSENHSDKVSIKAGVRDPHSDKAKKLKDLSNVTIVQATMGDSGLAQTFAGVSTLFIVTPPDNNKDELVIATAQCAKQASVGNIVVISSAMALLPDSNTGKTYSTIEKSILELGVPYTIIRLPAFLSFLFHHKTSVCSTNTFSHAVNPDYENAYVSVEDAGKASAAILVEPKKYTAQTIYIVSCLVSHKGLAEELSIALEREIKYVRISLESLVEQYTKFKPETAEAVMKTFKEIVDLVESRHPAVADGDVGIVKRITGEDSISLKEWVQKNKHGFMS